MGVRFLVRMLGYLAVAGGFVVLVADGARAIANSALQFTALGESLQSLLRERFLLLQPAVERQIHPLLWDPVLVTLLRAPTALAALLLGFVLIRLAAPRPSEIGFVTRR